jgi:uncharacterized protein YjbI with pentapeptide repeats
MANQEQLDILKKGVEVWNKWREENQAVKIDLEKADLSGVDLTNVNLSRANLSYANLRSLNLMEADLSEADLWAVNFIGSDLRGAYLTRSDLTEAYLNGANLTEAHLNGACFKYANLSRANLSRADLSRADFTETDLSETNLLGAITENTIFANIDLGETRGLGNVEHFYSSTVGTNTLQLSKGKISEAFLRGCGLPDWEIESAKLHNPDLNNEEINRLVYKIYDLRATQAIQISPLFISYSHTDSTFVDKLEKGLNEKGVRFWRDIHDMTAGRIETQIDRAISQNPTVLLILSENSLNSDWVQHEVRKARNLEKELGRDILCPIALDDGWKSSRWPQRVMEQVMEYNMLDFSKWEDESIFQAKFAKLLNGLDLFYKKPEK